MKYLKLAALLVLVFGAGAVFGVVMTRVVVQRTIRAMIAQPDLVRERVELNLVRRLRLGPEQRRRVRVVLQDTQQQMQELRRGVQPRFASIMSNAQSQVLAILSPEQRREFQKLRQENRRIFAGTPPPPE